MIKTQERRIALFLDFENLVTNTGISPANIDLRPAMDRLLEKGKVIFRRAYCDWSRFRDAAGRLHDLGVELVDVPPSTRSGKNGADMRLVIDALELSYLREHIDTFVIASGDSDFCPLAYKLRENNRMVIGLAVKEATSPLFVKACDEFIYLKPPARPERPATEERGKGKTGRDRREGKEEAEAPKKPRREIPTIAKEVVASLLASATGPLNPSLIKGAIVRKQPDFDERDHGFSTFSKLLDAMEKENLLRMQQLKGRQWYVVSPEQGDKSAAAARSGRRGDKKSEAAEAPADVSDELDDDEDLESYPDPVDDD
ncbi:MAG TPA: NYN domain-containing protein [Myxococcaceae bacterium]|nr:NYN domain-containing protein [Myxococcaceae bacterium]